MNTQEQLLNPSYSLRQSTLSMGKPQPQPHLYATSQVNVFPGKPQQQYYVTSSLPVQQVTTPVPLQAITGNYLNSLHQYGQVNYSTKAGLNAVQERKETESRITYHPYTRTYIDYEERVVLVPVQRVRINYYEKIYETEYVPKAVEYIVGETVPVEKQVLNVQYIPVEQKIVHFPKQKDVANGKSKKIIYYNPQGQEITEQEYISVFRPQNQNTVVNNAIVGQPRSSSSIQLVNAPIVEVVKIQRKSEVHDPSKEISRVSQGSQIYQQQEQIILEEKKSQTSRKLGQSHVKEVYKSNYNPANEPQGGF